MIVLGTTTPLLWAGLALAIAGAGVAVVAVLVGLAVITEAFIVFGDLAGWGG